MKKQSCQKRKKIKKDRTGQAEIMATSASA